MLWMVACQSTGDCQLPPVIRAITRTITGRGTTSPAIYLRIDYNVTLEDSHYNYFIQRFRKDQEGSATAACLSSVRRGEQIFAGEQLKPARGVASIAMNALHACLFCSPGAGPTAVRNSVDRYTPDQEGLDETGRDDDMWQYCGNGGYGCAEVPV